MSHTAGTGAMGSDTPGLRACLVLAVQARGLAARGCNLFQLLLHHLVAAQGGGGGGQSTPLHNEPAAM